MSVCDRFVCITLMILAAVLFTAVDALPFNAAELCRRQAQESLFRTSGSVERVDLSAMGESRMQKTGENLFGSLENPIFDLFQHSPREPDPALQVRGSTGQEGSDRHGAPWEELQGQLLVALGNDDLDEVRRLLQEGARVNRPFGPSGQTPLMAAESLQMATLLCQQGADAAATDADAGTVLHYAVSRKSAVELIRYLISLGADVNAKGWNGETPLLVAVAYFNENRESESPIASGSGSKVIVNMPPVRGPELNVAGSGLKRQRSFPEQVIEALAVHGADLNAVDLLGNTALMRAASGNHYQLVESLLELGADQTVRNRNGDTARDIAREMGHGYLYQILQ